MTLSCKRGVNWNFPYFKCTQKTNNKPSYSKNFNIFFNMDSTKRIATQDLHLASCNKRTRTCNEDNASVGSNQESDAETSAPQGTTNKSIPLFLQKLYNMVDSSTKNEEERLLISWVDIDPNLFVIYNPKLFEKKVFKNYFSSTISSFKRQLCYYGFKKITDGPLTAHIPRGSGVVYRQDEGFFRRGRPDLLSEVKRTSRISDPKEEANALRGKVDELQKEVAGLRKELMEMKNLKREMEGMRAEFKSFVRSSSNIACNLRRRASRQKNETVSDIKRRVSVHQDISSSVAPSNVLSRPSSISTRELSAGRRSVMSLLPKPLFDREFSTDSATSNHWALLKDVLFESSISEVGV